MPSTIVVAPGLLSPMPWFLAAFYPPWGKGLKVLSHEILLCYSKVYDVECVFFDEPVESLRVGLKFEF